MPRSMVNSASAAANRAVRRLGGDGAGVLEGVDVEQRRKDRRREAERRHAGELDRAGAFRAHRDAGEHGAGRACAGRCPSSRRRAPCRRRSRRRRRASRPCVEQRGRDLRRVHPDEEGGLADVRERRGEPLGQAVAALRDDLEAVGQPGPGSPSRTRRAGAAPRAATAAASVSAQRRARERGGLLRRAGRGQAGLDPPGDRRLGDHEQSGAH